MMTREVVAMVETQTRALPYHTCHVWCNGYLWYVFGLEIGFLRDSSYVSCQNTESFVTPPCTPHSVI